MINIKNLTIHYGEKKVFENTSFDLLEGNLYLLRAQSGRGKSTLLQYLACDLNAQYNGEYHFFDMDISRLNKDSIDNIKQTQISYLPQNSLLLKDMTVEEMLFFTSQLTQNQSKQELIDALELNPLMTKKIKTLSGGEKQRVAFVCSLMKNARLYLFDEPTSMVDEKYKSIMAHNIKKLAMSGKIVIVSTHEQEVYHEDCLMTIDGGFVELVERKVNFITDAQLSKIPKNSKKTMISAIVKHYFKQRAILKTMLILLISLCMSLSITTFMIGFANTKQQEEGLKTLSINELLVVNIEDEFHRGLMGDGGVLDPIDTAIEAQVRELEGVKQVYPYIFFPLHEVFLAYESQSFDYSTLEDLSWITLKKNSQEIAKVNFYNDYDVINGKPEYAIIPTYEHQEIDLMCSDVLEDGEIYITKSMAELLGITEPNGEVININLSVPIASEPYVDVDFENGNGIPGTAPLYVLENRDFKIKGILNGDFNNDTYVYSSSYGYQCVFFLPFEIVLEIQEECYQKYKPILEKLAASPQDGYWLKDYFEYVLPHSNKWPGSSVVVEVESEKYMQPLIREISLLDENLSVQITSSTSSEVELTQANNSTKLNTVIYSGLIFIALFFGVLMIKHIQYKGRRQDYLYLKMNGFSLEDIKNIQIRENMMEALLIFVALFLFTLASFAWLNRYSPLYVEMSIVVVIMQIVLVLLINGSISLLKVKLYD